MTSPSNSDVQNLLPVQAYFNLDGSFNTFIGQGVAFYATTNPIQSGLTITNSTLDSSPIGSTSPSTGVFTNISTTTGQVSTTPFNNTDIANKSYVDAVAQGLAFKQPALVATTGNITLSGLQTIDGVTVVAGDRVLVKNQTTQANNGIYLASATAWSRAPDANTWDEYLAAYLFVLSGTTQGGSAWVCTVAPGGTLGVTPITFTQFSNTALYTAGTGLTLNNFVFSITNTGVTATTYGSATASPVFAVNAQGQITSVTNTTITPAVGSITGLGTGVATALAVNTGIAGAFVVNGGALGTPSSGTLTNCTFPTLNQNTTGYAAGLAGGAAGSLPYQSAVNTTTFLAAGSNGQVLTLAAGVPSWATPSGGTVTSVSGTGSVNGITLTGTVTSSGSLTLGGTLGSIANSQLTNSSITFGLTAAALGTTVSAFNGVSIGATTASTGAFTYLSTSSSTNTTAVLGFNASNCNFALGATVASTYLQAVMQNKSGTAGASTNWAVSNDLGTDSTYYGEFGMNSSVFSASTPADFFSINNGIYFSGHDGDMSIGSGNGYKTYLAWGTTGQSAHVINVSGAIGLSTNLGTTPATSGTSGFGTAGYLMQTQGSGSAPTWVAQSTIAAGSATTATTATNATNIAITDDTTTATSVYPTWVTTTTGNLPQKTSSTKLSFVPSTGTLTATAFSGLASSATNIAGGVANQIPYQTGVGATGFIAAPTNSTYLTYTTGGGFAWSTIAGGGTVTSVAQSFTGGLISVAGSPITTSGTLALTVAGTSGGIPYFSGTSTWASSALLASNALMVGGGAGVAPSTITTGTGVVTALGVNTGTAGAFVVNGGALGIPSSGTVTNLTGTASININGTVGATTANTGSFTSLAYTTTLTGGTGIVNLGSGQFYKDASGNVGIGTSSPSSFGTLAVVTAGNPVLYIGSSTASSAGAISIQGSGASSYPSLNFNQSATNYWTIGQRADTNLYLYRQTGSGDVLIPSGNVGIGTSSPSTALQVNGTATATSFSGAGTGLTGTAASLSIGGNAATATTAANGGVTSIVAGTGISISGGTGAVTVTNTVSVNAQQLAKAWCYWQNSTTILASYNVSSITKGGTGNYTINFTSAFSDANYVDCQGCWEYQRGYTGVYSKTTTTFQFEMHNTSNGATIDMSYGSFAFFR